MTTTEFASLVRKKTRTNSTTFPDADILLYMNIFKNEIASKIVAKNAGYFLVPTTFDLVASSTSREYRFPSDMLNRMHKLELKFNSSDARFPSTYKKEYEGSETESEIVRQFSNSPGGFFHVIRRRALFILSGTIAAVTGGGRLWYHAYPADFTALNGSTEMALDPSDTTFGFPTQFQELLARRVGIEYKSNLPQPKPLTKLELRYDLDLEAQLNDLVPVDNSGEVVGDSLDSIDTGNDGWDY